MKIALVGYGKMGRMIERIATERGHEIALRLDEFNNANFEGITAGKFRGVDVAIDFSIPAAAVREHRAHCRPGREPGRRHYRLAGAMRTRPRRCREGRYRAGLEPQLFGGRQRIFPHRQ